jgi:hypothetical protein
MSVNRKPPPDVARVLPVRVGTRGYAHLEWVNGWFYPTNTRQRLAENPL